MDRYNPDFNELIDLGNELVRRGLVLGSGGNLSLRQDDTIYTSRSGTPLHQLTADDFLPVDLNTHFQRPPEHPRPSLETPLHLAGYRSRPNARAMIHCHPVHAIAWAMQGRPLPACTPEFALYLGYQVECRPYLLPGSEALADTVSATLPTSPAIMLGNHGVLIAGQTVAQARLRTLYLDETARICLLAAAAGQIRPLSQEEFDTIVATYGNG